ncbi:MAG TPA: Flp family type IVb pilin [Acidimicrobiia bacterium]|jgi:Flp pilus assembly pilin Flp
MGKWAHDRSVDPERGAALAEWGLLVVLIAVVAMLALTLAGEEVSGMYSGIASSIDI